MSREKIIYLLASLILSACTVFAQTSSLVNASFEMKKERGMYSKVFLKPSGIKEAIFSSTPVHYNKNGTWENITTTILSNQGGYQNETNVIQSYFPVQMDSANKIRLVVNGNQEIFIHSKKKLVILNALVNFSSQSIQSVNSTANIFDNNILYPNIYAGISDQFTILNGQVKNNVILNAPPTFLDDIASGYFGFMETLELPVGWQIIAADYTNDTLTSSGLLITDSEGNPVLSIPEPVFFDSYGLGADGASMIDGKFLVVQQNNQWNITTLVPIEWLKDNKTQYPISIDPTIVIAGTTGGWQSPNNWVDNPSFVFLGVCCANLTHRAWIKFNTSAIPAGSCISNVELQVNVTTVVAATPEIVFANDVTGAFGPYGGLNPAAYTDFGNGFYTSFTLNGLGLYGYYSLGASANALLQAQLPLGWFQVALQYSNEPSTNYKIITATSSNLRVTYPCALPVELLSFDAKCDNDAVNLRWTTASEINNQHFTIGRSTDGINYETIGTVIGSGNSNQPTHYSFVDSESPVGTSYYYLEQVDFDGTTEYLDLVGISCADALEFNIFPNPSTGIFIVEGAKQDDDIIITDVLGHIVFQSTFNGESMEVDLSKQVNGTYMLKRIAKNGTFSKKIIIYK